jgi:hypothetical protein
MHNYCKTIGALAAATSLVAGTAQAEVEYELHAGYTNEYIFRGVKQGTDLVETGVDVKTQFAGLNLSAGAWYAGYTIKDPISIGLDADQHELDLYAEVAKDLGFATLAVGYIKYDTDSNLANAVGFGHLRQQEVYFSAARDLGFAEASLTYYWDVQNNELAGGNNDGYAELALKKSYELNSCLAVNVRSNVGYLVEQGQATAWTTKVALDWGFAEHAKLSPFVQLSVALSDDNDTRYNGSGNEFVGGSMLSVSF